MRTPLAAAALAAALVVFPAIGQARSDKPFLQDAIRGNLAGVKVGQLAEQRAVNPDVKAYGQTLIDDHTSANTQAIAVAQQIGLKAPTMPSLKRRATYGYFASLKGSAFDGSFARHMVSDHKKDIGEYRAASKWGPVASCTQPARAQEAS